MVSIDLDPVHQQQLEELAQSQGQAGATLARKVLLDYLDFQSLPNDSAEDWAQASIALSPEILNQEDWSASGNGP